MTGRVAGKVALVTGGAQGLGEAAARMLAREGARVAITDVNFEGAKKVAATLNETRDGSAIAVKHDVTSETGWADVLNATARAFGGLHVLVNNAGIGLTKDLEDITLQEWRRVHAIDLDGVFLGCKLAVPLIARTVKETGLGGSIVNISSISGIIAGHNMAAYNSAKAAVRHLSKSVALYCARKGYGIRSQLGASGVHRHSHSRSARGALRAGRGLCQAGPPGAARPHWRAGRHRLCRPISRQRRVEIRHRGGTESGWRHIRYVSKAYE